MAWEAENYDTALSMSKTRRRKLANNTYLTVHEDKTDDYFGVKLHDTVIVRWYSDGRVVLDSGGWRTRTTKDRMNIALKDWSVWTEDGIWYVKGPLLTCAYKDGMTLYPDGTVSGEGDDPKLQKKIRKDIRKFTHKYMVAFWDGDVPTPGGGDCWGCYLNMRDTDHLLSHMDEEYYVPSLLAKAIQRFPISQAARHVLSVAWSPDEAEAQGFSLEQEKVGWSSDIANEQLEKSLRRYLYEQLGSAS